MYIHDTYSVLQCTLHSALHVVLDSQYTTLMQWQAMKAVQLIAVEVLKEH